MITAKDAKRISDRCAVSNLEGKLEVIEEEIIRAANCGFYSCAATGMNQKMIVDALEKAGYKVTIDITTGDGMRIKW